MATEWTNDDGRARVWRAGHHMHASVPGRRLMLFERATPTGAAAWIGRYWVGDDVETIAVAADGDDMLVAHFVQRVWARGTEDDPKVACTEFRCSPVIRAGTVQ